ncbi:hypothetical protein ADEAN_000757000 [Angomonas deanei]|uniref:Uncharacterized protein n=1 Tax=Angomonas deanei TaxID=59799 RepID=A0A7G2CJT2_9TRYP|nr:hypothetical protein ADEAN_000757000 [Angomonas deanei]
MGCGGSKDQDKKENDKKKSEEQKSEKQAQEAGSPEQGEQPVEPSAAAQEGQEAVDREVAGGAQAGADPISEEERQERAAIELAAAEGQEQVERAHIEGEAAVSSPAQANYGATAEGEPVVSRTVKRRPERDPNASTSARKPPLSPRAVPVSATFRDAEGNVIEEQPTSTAAPAEELGSNGQLIELPKDAPEWKVMRPPADDTSSWRLLRQVRMVFQLQNVSAI